jgi:hypothetical protein
LILLPCLLSSSCQKKEKIVKFPPFVAENNAAVGRGGQDLRHRARQEDERVSIAFAPVDQNSSEYISAVSTPWR